MNPSPDPDRIVLPYPIEQYIDQKNYRLLARSIVSRCFTDKIVEQMGIKHVSRIRLNLSLDWEMGQVFLLNLTKQFGKDFPTIGLIKLIQVKEFTNEQPNTVQIKFEVFPGEFLEIIQ